MLNDRYYNRRFFLPILLVVIIALYIGRLYYLQILSSKYKVQAKNNACYYQTEPAIRGLIFDRNGQLLVSNNLTYDLMVTIHETKKRIDTIGLAKLFDLDLDNLKIRFKNLRDRRKNKGYTAYRPQLLINRLSPQYVARFQEQRYRFPGFSLRLRNIRKYNYHNAAHILGYLGEANRVELKKDSLLELGDYIGKSGVESYYDKELRGKKSVEIFFRDARGRIKGRYRNGEEDTAPIDGSDLILSIDAKLQSFGEELMRGKRGAIVAIEPNTGEILCLVSSPSFDPKLLDIDHRSEGLRKLQKLNSKPLFNRAIQGTYPPGSTFKTAQAAIFQEEGVVTPATAFSCNHGYTRLRGRPRCHGHAPMPRLVYSIATSCNSYYCWGMHKFLDDRERYPSIQEAFEVWKNHIVDLGFGYKTGVDLLGEKRGYIPNSKVYDRYFPNGWSSSTIISISIGQGEILTTPLQLANLASIIANRGYWYIPHVIHKFSADSIPQQFLEKKDTNIASEKWEWVVKGMAMAVTSGTCRGANFAPKEIAVCGKTGTAENSHGEDHSAFIGFAPKDKPQIAISVYVENGGFGATYGVPIGRLMMEYYLKKGKLSKESQAIADRLKQKSIIYRYAN